MSAPMSVASRRGRPLEAALDVELPSVACYGPAQVSAVRDGLVPAGLIDRAAARVLRQKCDLGLLDPGWPVGAAAQSGTAAAGTNGAVLDLDPPGHRALARRLAEESVVLLANRDAVLPLRPDARVAVVGPLADDPLAFFGCYTDLAIEPRIIGTDGMAEISCLVRNTGDRAGDEVVQLYLSDPVAQVVRPERWLAGFARVPLEPGEERRVTFRLHADRTAFTGRAGTRIVEPGEIGVAVGGASDRLPLRGAFTLAGPERAVGPDRVLDTPSTSCPSPPGPRPA